MILIMTHVLCNLIIVNSELFLKFELIGFWIYLFLKKNPVNCS